MSRIRRWVAQLGGTSFYSHACLAELNDPKLDIVYMPNVHKLKIGGLVYSPPLKIDASGNLVFHGGEMAEWLTVVAQRKRHHTPPPVIGSQLGIGAGPNSPSEWEEEESTVARLSPGRSDPRLRLADFDNEKPTREQRPRRHKRPYSPWRDWGEEETTGVDVL